MVGGDCSAIAGDDDGATVADPAAASGALHVVANNGPSIW